MMDKQYGYGQQQDRRRRKKADSDDPENISDRLADGFDLMSVSEDDPKDRLPPEVTGAKDDDAES